MQTNEKLAIPPERRIVGAAQDEAHRITVPADEGRVLFARLRGAVADEDVAHLFDRDRDSFHRGGRSNSLRLEIAAKTTSPCPGHRTPVVELGFPAVEFLGQIEDGCRVVWQEHSSDYTPNQLVDNGNN